MKRKILKSLSLAIFGISSVSSICLTTTSCNQEVPNVILVYKEDESEQRSFYHDLSAYQPTNQYVTFGHFVCTLEYPNKSPERLESFNEFIKEDRITCKLIDREGVEIRNELLTAKIQDDGSIRFFKNDETPSLNFENFTIQISIKFNKDQWVIRKASGFNYHAQNTYPFTLENNELAEAITIDNTRTVSTILPGEFKLTYNNKDVTDSEYVTFKCEINHLENKTAPNIYINKKHQLIVDPYYGTLPTTNLFITASYNIPNKFNKQTVLQYSITIGENQKIYDEDDSGLSPFVIENGKLNFLNPNYNWSKKWGTDCCNTLSIPSSVTSIDENFYKNTSDQVKEYISYINFESGSLKQIPQNTFKNFKNLVKVNFTNIETIADNAFEGCSNLHTVILSSSIKTIGNNAFKNCPKLVIDQDTVKDNDCFTLATNLGDNAKVVIKTQGNNSNWSTTNPVVGCLASGEIDFSKAYSPSNDESSTTNSFANSAITKVDLGNIVTIDEKAFSECLSLKTIVFHNSNINVGNLAFSDCQSLSDIYFDKDFKDPSLVQNFLRDEKFSTDAFDRISNSGYIHYEDMPFRATDILTLMLEKFLIDGSSPQVSWFQYWNSADE